MIVGLVLSALVTASVTTALEHNSTSNGSEWSVASTVDHLVLLTSTPEFLPLPMWNFLLKLKQSTILPLSLPPFSINLLMSKAFFLLTWRLVLAMMFLTQAIPLGLVLLIVCKNHVVPILY